MKIIGIDPGLVQTGFGIINVSNNQTTLIDYGIIKPQAKDTLANRLLTIFNDVCEIISNYNPQIFAIEDVFYGKNIKSAMRLGQARGASMVAAAFMGTFLTVIFWLAGFKYTLAGRAAIYNQLSTILITLMAAIFLKERMNCRRWIAVAFAVAGALLVSTS